MLTTFLIAFAISSLVMGFIPVAIIAHNCGYKIAKDMLKYNSNYQCSEHIKRANTSSGAYFTFWYKVGYKRALKHDKNGRGEC